MTVGERIAQKRKENNLSMESLGELLGVGKSAVNKWEKGHVQRISRSMIIKMASIFDCDPAWLGGYSDIDQSSPSSKIIDYYAYLHSDIIENPNIDKEEKEEIALAIKKYEKYKHLPVEVQKTIDLLLEQSQSDS